MDEQIHNNQSPPAVPEVSPYKGAEAPKPPVRFSAQDWLFVPAALLLAWLCMRVYSAAGFVMQGPAGLGVPVFTAALLLAVYLRLGKRAVRNRYSLLLTVCTFLLALSCFLCANPWLFFLNSFAALGVGTLAVFSLSGQLRRTAASLASLGEGFCLFFQAIFVHILKPFQALGGLLRTDRKRAAGVLIGILCAIPILALVIYLLAAADSVFGGLFRSLSDWLQSTDLPHWLWWAVRLLFVALLFFSGLYFLTVPRKAPEPKPQPEAGVPETFSAAPFLTVLALLDAVYLVFAVIQVVYLFGGAETAAMQGGYALYARSGFFQLVAVAAINVCAVLCTCLWSRRCTAGFRSLRVLSLAMVALTLVILASAVYRMGLYISVYGLSLLRLLTLWGMLVILVSLGAAVWKTLRPDFRFFQVFFLFALISWVLLNLANPNAIIANYNVDAYLSGAVEQVDVHYLRWGLTYDGAGTDILPALHKLEQSSAYGNPDDLREEIELVELVLAREKSWEYLHLGDILYR